MIQTNKTQNPVDEVTTSNIMGEGDGSFVTTEELFSNEPVGTAPTAPGFNWYQRSSEFFVTDKLSTAGEAYLEEVVRQLKLRDPDIEVLKLTTTNTFLFHKKGNGGVLVFEELFRRTVSDDRPFTATSTCIQQVFNEIKNCVGFPTGGMITTYTITEHDYGRESQISAQLYAMANYDRATEHMDLTAMSENSSTYRINYDLRRVAQGHEMYSPFAIREPMKAGFVVEVWTPSDQYNPKNNNSANGHWAIFMAVSLDINFYVPKSAGLYAPQIESMLYNIPEDQKILPMVMISEISTGIPTLQTFCFALGGTAEVADSNSWHSHFTEFLKDSVYNIGKLLINKSTSEPMYVDDRGSFESFVTRHFHDRCAIGVSIQEGRTTIPWLSAFTLSTRGNVEDVAINSSLTQIIGGFLNRNLGKNMEFTSTDISYTDISGTYQVTHDKYESTREIDYFKILDITKNNFELADKFLFTAPYKIYDHLEVINELSFKNITPIAITKHCVFTNTFIDTIVDALGGQLTTIDSNTNGYRGHRNLPMDSYVRGLENIGGSRTITTTVGNEIRQNNYSRNNIWSSYR